MKKIAGQIYGSMFFPIMGYPLAVVPVIGDTATRFVADTNGMEYNFTFTPHYHDFSELVIITSGYGTQNISGTDYQFSAGDVFLLQGNTTHFFTASKNLKLFNILFNSDRLVFPHEHLQKLHGYNVLFRTEPQMRSSRNFKNQLHLTAAQLATADTMVQRIQDELKLQNAGFEAVATAILIELITFCCRCYEYDPDRRPAAIPQVSLILTRLENQYDKDWTLSQLARLVNTSERHLTRLFHRVMDTSPIDYLLQLRLRHATGYLEQEHLNISEIAELCGFHDSNYFSKKFKEQYQVSPLQYRKKHSAS